MTPGADQDRLAQWRDGVKASTLKSRSRHAALTIADWWSVEGIAEIELSRLMRQMASSRRSVQYALGDLRRAGWIALGLKAMQHRPPAYFMTFPGEFDISLRRPALARPVVRIGQRAAIPVAVRRYVFERDGNACIACAATEDLALDHIFPWSLGGTDAVENLQTLCRSCNSRKGARTDASSSPR